MSMDIYCCQRRLVSVLAGFLCWLGILCCAMTATTTSIVENEYNSQVEDFSLVPDLVIGTKDGETGVIFGRVWGIAVNSEFEIYVLDKAFDHVEKYDSLGVYKQTIGRSGEAPGEFNFPFAIAVDAEDRLYVADRAKVVVFERDGAYAYEFAHKLSDSFIRSIRIDSLGNVFLSCFEVFEQHIIHKFDKTGVLLSSFCDSYAAKQDVDVRIERTLAGGGMDIDENGTIFFTQMIPYEIRTFSADGFLLSTIHRENHFMRSPDIETTGSGVRIGRITGSFSIVCLRNGLFLNVVKNVASNAGSPNGDEMESVLDLFDYDGKLLATRRVGNGITPKCADLKGRLYAIDEEEYPRIVRYRVVIE